MITAAAEMQIYPNSIRLQIPYSDTLSDNRHRNHAIPSFMSHCCKLRSKGHYHTEIVRRHGPIEHDNKGVVIVERIEKIALHDSILDVVQQNDGVSPDTEHR